MEAAFTFSEGVWVSARINVYLAHSHQTTLDFITGWAERGSHCPGVRVPLSLGFLMRIGNLLPAGLSRVPGRVSFVLPCAKDKPPEQRCLKGGQAWETVHWVPPHCECPEQGCPGKMQQELQAQFKFFL